MTSALCITILGLNIKQNLEPVLFFEPACDTRSDGSVVDDTVVYQFGDSKIDRRFIDLSDETLNPGPISV